MHGVHRYAMAVHISHMEIKTHYYQHINSLMAGTVKRVVHNI